MMTIISPHLDDAVLSLGQYMATRPGVLEVVTVLAGFPDDDRLSDYDRASGFTSSALATAVRRDEDRHALLSFGALVRHWQFLDGQYGEARDPEEITALIAARYTPDELMFAPLGIGHPDHRLVAACARDAVASHAGEVPVGLLLYEELPYRVLWPEQAHAALAEVAAEGWTIDELPWPLEQGDRTHRQAKAAAIACYRSQFPDGADDPCLLVPERVWRVTR